MRLAAWLASIGVVALIAVLGSGRLRNLPVSPPLIAVVVGTALGPYGARVLDLPEDTVVLHGVSEIVIAIALMATALRFPIDQVRQDGTAVLVLVSLVLIAMVGVVAALGTAVLGLPLAAALVLATVLAPTDPVLSSSIVTGEPAERDLPTRLRRLLSTESGANDGLAMPLVVFAVLAFLGGAMDRWWTQGLLSTVIAVVLGGVAGTAAGRTLRRLHERREIEQSAFFMFTITLAVTVLGGVNLVEGNGILAVFVAGLAFHRAVGESISSEEYTIEEGANRVLVLPLFVLFGTILPWEAWSEHPAMIVVFAAGVLTVRRVPLLLLRKTLDLGWDEAVFLTWLAPIGGAALFYLSYAAEEGAIAPIVWSAATATVALSTLVHGAVATPARQLFARRRRTSAAEA